MDRPPNPARPPLLQSPWYWLYVFCTAGLIGLVLTSHKLNQRQLHVERNFQGRQRALESRAGLEPVTGLSTEGRTALSLQPLYLALGAGMIAAWVVLWWRHFRRPAPPKLATGSPTLPPDQPAAEVSTPAARPPATKGHP